MTHLTDKHKENIKNLVKKQFYDDVKKGETAKKVYQKLSLIYHPDKCIMKELPIGLTFEESQDQWDWEPSKELKKHICDELFKNLSNVYDEFQRLQLETPDIDDDDESKKTHKPYTSEGKTYHGAGIYTDSTGIHYEGEWSCANCGPDLKMNPLFHPEECARCGLSRFSSGNTTLSKAEKAAASSKLKYKQSRDHFKDFKQFMKDTHDINVTQKNFDKLFDNPEYLSEYRDLYD